ncbi:MULTISPECIES: ComEA family DNA-binding protein [Clostridium]|uniref:ComEA family DNA-binding protein n=1 Tax=Clostridium TaxID=1485 RepID=UPI00082691E8|nr:MULTISPECIES: ComEA family DNA-binding protein [Clostridium]PJI07110.1 competence protein ComEA [Clostridium sp. CT7]
MKNKKVFIGSIALVVIFAIMIFVGYKVENKDDENGASYDEAVSEVTGKNKSKENYSASKNENKNENKNVSAQIFGAVKNPGVYTLKGSGRIKDLINAAGGFADNADKFSVNGAAKVTDGANIYVKAQGETTNKAASAGNSSGAVQAASQTSGSGGASQDEKLDINTATAEDIVNKKIKGIGAGLAKKIVDYREKNGGRINSAEDLQKAIGPKRGKDLMDYVTIN